MTVESYPSDTPHIQRDRTVDEIREDIASKIRNEAKTQRLPERMTYLKIARLIENLDL